MSDNDRFCDLCDVDKSLHPRGEVEPWEPDGWECEAAERKADFMDRFWSFGTGVPR